MKNLIDKKVGELIPPTYILTDSEPKLRVTDLLEEKAVIEIEVKKDDKYVPSHCDLFLSLTKKNNKETEVRNQSYNTMIQAVYSEVEWRKLVNNVAKTLFSVETGYNTAKPKKPLFYTEDFKDGSFPSKSCRNCINSKGGYMCNNDKCLPFEFKRWEGELRGEPIYEGDKCWLISLITTDFEKNYREWSGDSKNMFKHKYFSNEKNAKDYYNKLKEEKNMHKFAIGDIVISKVGTTKYTIFSQHKTYNNLWYWVKNEVGKLENFNENELKLAEEDKSKLKKERSFQSVIDLIIEDINKDPKAKEWFEDLKKHGMKEVELLSLVNHKTTGRVLTPEYLYEILESAKIPNQESGSNLNIDNPKNIVEVEIPEGFELKSKILHYSDGNVAKPSVTRIEWKEKQPTKSCSTCLFEYNKRHIPREICSHCQVQTSIQDTSGIKKEGMYSSPIYTFEYTKWKDKKDLTNTKIWIRNNKRLKDLLIAKIDSLGYIKFAMSKKVDSLCILSDGYFTTISEEGFIRLSEIEITPQDLEISEREYTPLFTIYGNTPLYEGDNFYAIDIRSMRFLRPQGKDNMTGFTAYMGTRKPAEYEIYFKTKEEATEWIQKQFDKEIQKVKEKYGK